MLMFQCNQQRQHFNMTIYHKLVQKIFIFFLYFREQETGPVFLSQKIDSWLEKIIKENEHQNLYFTEISVPKSCNPAMVIYEIVASIKN